MNSKRKNNNKIGEEFDDLKAMKKQRQEESDDTIISQESQKDYLYIDEQEVDKQPDQNKFYFQQSAENKKQEQLRTSYIKLFTQNKFFRELDIATQTSSNSKSLKQINKILKQMKRYKLTKKHKVYAQVIYLMLNNQSAIIQNLETIKSTKSNNPNKSRQGFDKCKNYTFEEYKQNYQDMLKEQAKGAKILATNQLYFDTYFKNVRELESKCEQCAQVLGQNILDPKTKILHFQCNVLKKTEDISSNYKKYNKQELGDIYEKIIQITQSDKIKKQLGVCFGNYFLCKFCYAYKHDFLYIFPHSSFLCPVKLVKSFIVNRYTINHLEQLPIQDIIDITKTKGYNALNFVEKELKNEEFQVTKKINWLNHILFEQLVNLTILFEQFINLDKQKIHQMVKKVYLASFGDQKLIEELQLNPTIVVNQKYTPKSNQKNTSQQQQIYNYFPILEIKKNH